MPSVLEYLKCSEGELFLRMLANAKGLDIQRLSSFEKFALALECLSYCPESDFYTEALACLAFDTDKKYTPHELFGRELQKTLWRAINGDEKIALPKSSDENYNSPTLACIVKNNVEKCKKTVVFDFEALPEFVKKSTADSLEKISEKIAEISDKYSIYIKPCTCGFKAPDLYRASLCLEKIKCNEKCNSQELNSLGFWALSGAILCRKTKLEILLSGKPQEIFPLADCLNTPAKRGKAEAPSISYLIKSEEDCRGFFANRREFTEKNIPPTVLLDGERDDMRKCVKALAKAYPIGFVSFARAVK